MRLPRIILSYAIIFALVFTQISWAQAGQPKLRFGGGFDQLSPEQQQLVRRWVDEYQQIMDSKLDARAAYDDLALSTRTTFDAVTNALQKTELTDADTGESLGNALSLVEMVESVHGEVRDSRGDEQFRVYVLLANDALARLYRCKQFKRVGDNTVYHIGYPINFRQQGGAPSIQISVTRTGYRADIDVDYRPSGGPSALINGHLTSANSDVRAGSNYPHHVNRWEGLQQWWLSLVGISPGIPRQVITALSSGNTPPRLKANVPVQDAVFDFFQTYLVDDKPEVSLAYISVKALPCVAEFGTGEKATDGLVRLRIYRNMKNVSDRYGKLKSLDQVMQGVVMFPPGAVPVTQQHGNLFAIAQLPDDVALKLDCRARQKLALAEDLPRATHRTGQYYGVSTILWNTDHSRGQVVTSVWSKEANAWKMVSWQIGDPFGKATGPQVAEPEPEPKRRLTLPSANPALLRAVTGLLSDWLIKDEYNLATTYFAKESLDCASTEAKQSPAASGGTATLKSWLKEVGKSSGKGTSLDQIIETVPYGHPHMQAVPQPYRSEFLLARIGDDLAAMGSCSSKSSGSAINKTVGVSPPTFDADVFRVAFGFRQRRGATVTLDFARRDGAWKVVAFDTVAD